MVKINKAKEQWLKQATSVNHERNEIINIKRVLQEPKKGHMEKSRREMIREKQREPNVCAENSSVNNWLVFKS